MTEPIRFLLTIPSPAADTPEAIEDYRRWIVDRLHYLDVDLVHVDHDSLWVTDEEREAYLMGLRDGSGLITLDQETFDRLLAIATMESP